MNAGYHSNIRHDIVSMVPQGTRLLDVGGGTGATARYLKEIGRVAKIGVLDQVVDQHSDGLDFVSSANLDDHCAIEGFLADAGALDVILFLDVLEHLIDPWALVELMSRHLSPKGVLIASVPNVRHVSALRPLLMQNRWRYSQTGILDRTHLRFFVRSTAIELLQPPGFFVDQVTGTAITNRKHKLMNALTFGTASSFFTLQYLIRARRAD